MVGYYDAVPQDIEQMIDFATVGLRFLPLFFTALPATDLYNVAQERGYVNGDFGNNTPLMVAVLFLNLKRNL